MRDSDRGVPARDESARPLRWFPWAWIPRRSHSTRGQAAEHQGRQVPGALVEVSL